MRLYKTVIQRSNYAKRNCFVILVLLIITVVLARLWFQIIQVEHIWSSEDMDIVLNKERENIRALLKNYTFPAETSIKYLRELLPEKGGSQLITIMICYWRGGSTFLGDIFNSHPATVYLYEPLKMFRTRQIRAPPDSETAFRLLHHLINSDYLNAGPYLNYEMHRNSYTKRKNIPLHKVCQKHKDKCFDPIFLSRFMKLFPFVVLKITRLRLSLIENFLENHRYNIRAVLLLRDPRGMMMSRNRHEWCRSNPDCINPLHTCSDMISDYATALRFAKKFPKQFTILRYEDLALFPKMKTEELFKFIGLKFHLDVERFLLTHTKFRSGDEFTTFRNSSATAFAWRNVPPEDILDVQSNCEVAMKLWGYKIITNFSSLDSFFPMKLDFKLTARFPKN